MTVVPPPDAPSSGPTWYDVLDVERDASTDDIRTAWRAATDRAEPGTGRFRRYNEAAETLLDPERRAAYDASLAPVVEPEPVRGPAADDDDDPTPSTADADETVDDAAAEDGTAATGPGRLVRLLGRVPVLVLVLLLVVVLVLAGVGAWLTQRVQQDARVADAREQAPVAAEQAAEAVLSYDYRTLDEDRARAVGFLVGDFREEYDDNFDLLQEQEDGSPGLAVQSKTVVAAQVRGSGVSAVSQDGDTVRVLVFVNQTSEKEGQDPQVFLNRVSMTMVERDGRWLVSDLRSY